MPAPKHIELAADYTKALGIFLVVTGHTLRGLQTAGLFSKSPFWAAVDGLIYLFHMPLFFYVSGLFFAGAVKRHGYGGLVRKNIGVLLLPMIIWSYLQFTLQYLSPGAANMQVNAHYVLFAVFPPKQQFWFLGALFIITALAGLVARMEKPRSLLWASMIALFIVIALARNAMLAGMVSNPTYAFFGQIVIHMPYFILGILLDSGVIARFRVNNRLCVALFAGSLCAYELIPVLTGMVAVVTSVICILAIYRFMKNIEQTNGQGPIARFVLFIGMNSMIIYLAQVIFSAAARSVLLKLHVTNPVTHLTAGIAVGLFGPLLLVPLGRKWAQYSPRVAQAFLPVRVSR